ncbi:MAG TPA: chemotaxis protein CheW [Geobacteraceae bacterium]
MNLADIRKKAQLEAQSRQLPKPSTPLSAPAERVAVVTGAAIPTMPEPAPVVEVLTVPAPSSDDLAACPSISTAVAPVAQRFDPLAVILAGRELADRELADRENVASGEATPEAVAPLAETSEEFLCFRVANEKYAISIMAIKEIIKLRDATEVPRMPRFINGIISLRGIIVPIFDMHRRLGLALGESTGKERVVIVRHEDGFCGVLVDEVIQVVRLRTTAIEQPPAVLEGIDRDFVAGIGRHGDAMLILLNLHNILDLTLR